MNSKLFRSEEPIDMQAQRPAISALLPDICTISTDGILHIAKHSVAGLAREYGMRLALKLGVGRIVLDNWSELERLTRIARESMQRPGVLLRVAPGVDTVTHRYLQTGHTASKFGFPLEHGEAKAALLRILGEGEVALVGLHAQSGTM